MEALLPEIDQKEALRYLGWRGAPPDAQTAAQLAQAAKTIARLAAPQQAYAIYPVEQTAQGIALAGTALVLPGADIARHLARSSRCIVLAATLGMAVEQAIGRAQRTDMAMAVLLDACASAAIESVCDALQAQLAEHFAPLHLTARFSPGYGDLPLTLQPDICRLLQTGPRIGLHLTGSGLLLPQKSVTALIGVGDQPSGSAGGCDTCPARAGCRYQKEGTSCAKP